MDRADFEKLVDEALMEIPEKFLKILENVAVVVENEPNPEQLKKLGIRRDQLLFGLYEGVPQTKRGPNYGMVLPDKITIFQKSIEQYCQTETEMKECIKNTVRHEIAHHLGSDEEGARRAARK